MYARNRHHKNYLRSIIATATKRPARIHHGTAAHQRMHMCHFASTFSSFVNYDDMPDQ